MLGMVTLELHTIYQVNLVLNCRPCYSRICLKHINRLFVILKKLISIRNLIKTFHLLWETFEIYIVVLEDSENSLMFFDVFVNVKQINLPPGLLTQRSFSQMTFSWNWQPSYEIKQFAKGVHCSPEKKNSSFASFQPPHSTYF